LLTTRLNGLVPISITGEKLRWGSYGSFEFTAGIVPKAVDVKR